MDPDFVMLAPPCGPWSQILLINQRIPLQIRESQRKRAAARNLLMFVEEVVRFQRVRGRAVAVENPRASLIWNQDPTKCPVAQLGMTTAVVDMCACEERRPDTKELVKKPTLFKGTKEVCEAIGGVRTGDHEYGSVMGSRFGPPCQGPNAAKLTMSERAGGYTEQLAEKISQGAERFHESRRATENFPMDAD